MKKVLLLTLVGLLGAGQAYAIGGSIGVFSAPTALNCELTDVAPALQSVLVIHTLSDGSLGVQYQAQEPACAIWSFLGEIPVFSQIGDARSGASVGYGVCLSMTPVNPIVTQITTINFFGSGLASACCYFSVKDHPGFPETTPISSNCVPIAEREKQPASAGQLIINPQLGCNCAVPNETSTWGQIKELYAR